MKIVYIGIHKNNTKVPAELVSERELSSYNFFTRGGVSEGTAFLAHEIAKKIEPRQQLSAVDEDRGFIVHAYGRPEGICGIAITDLEYPENVAHPLLRKVCDEFVAKYPQSSYANITHESVKDKPNPLPFSELKTYITKYQDPQQADSIMKLQKELDETTTVLHKTIESVLERGQKIDDLVAKSDMLSNQSKMFFTQAKKQNSCCIVM